MRKKSKKDEGGARKSPSQVFVNFVLDETGSMSVCREATISGFNEYISKLKQDQPKLKFTLTKFDSTKMEVVHKATPIKDVVELNQDTYVPGAMTPLYDAIATTVKAMESDSKGKPVLCIIMTDGEENASKEYTRDKIFALIKGKEKEGWTFIYLGANQDAWAVGQAIGLHKGNVMNYSTRKTKMSYRSLANVTQCYAAHGGAQTTSAFADADVKEDDIN